MIRQFSVAIAAVALAVAATVAVAAPASAHDVLVDSSPRAGSTVTELPVAFGITMGAPMVGSGLGQNGFALQVTDAAGRFYGDGCLDIVDATMSMGATLGEPGTYRMVWQVVSSDGHPTSGEVDFTWTPSDPDQQSVGSTQPPGCGEAPSDEPTDTSGHGHEESGPSTQLPLEDVLWIGGAVLVVAIAITVTLLVVRRRPNGS